MATIRGIDHVGVTVPDVEAASAFLSEALGALPVYDVVRRGDKPVAGPKAERQLGMPKGGEIIHMRLMRIGDSAMLELFQVDKVDKCAPTIAGYGPHAYRRLRPGSRRRR